MNEKKKPQKPERKHRMKKGKVSKYINEGSKKGKKQQERA